MYLKGSGKEFDVIESECEKLEYSFNEWIISSISVGFAAFIGLSAIFNITIGFIGWIYFSCFYAAATK